MVARLALTGVANGVATADLHSSQDHSLTLCQSVPMLYNADWDGLLEGPTWGAWWTQNSYGTTMTSLPFMVRPREQLSPPRQPKNEPVELSILLCRGRCWVQPWCCTGFYFVFTLRLSGAGRDHQGRCWARSCAACAGWCRSLLTEITSISG